MGARISRRKFVAGAAAAGLGTTALGYLGSREFVVERSTLALPRWGVDGFRVVQLTDVHLNNAALEARCREAVTVAVAERPDLIVVTGDFLNEADPASLARIERAFAGLGEARCPAYAVLGNHDYWCREPRNVMEAIRRTPLRLLRNETADLGGVSLVGLDDAIVNRHRPDVLAPGRHAESLLVLLHEPDYVRDLPGHPSLVLSGHSHGGEVCLPFGHALHTPRGAWDYVRGHYPAAGGRPPVYVSRGVGTVGPFRVFCPPEVTVLTLRPA